MSERLTNDLREKICSALLKHRFAKDAEKLRKERSRLADRLYKARFSLAERKLMDSLPEHFLPTGASISLAAGYRDNLDYSGNLPFKLRHLIAPAKDEFRRVPYKSRCGATAKIDPDSALGKDCLNHRDKIDALQQCVEETRGQIVACLRSVTTTKRLADEWPEVAPFLPSARPNAPLPAINPESLNRNLGLPVEGEWSWADA